MKRLLPLLLLCACLAGCGGGDSPHAPSNAALSMAPDRWEFFYSDGVPSHPAPEPVGWSFSFPLRDGVHYLLTSYGQDMSQRNAVTIAGEIEATPGTVWEFPGRGDGSGCGQGYASTGVMIQRRDDDIVKAFGRWWATVRLPMQAGAFSVVIPLNPENWSSVYGDRGDSSPEATQAFRDALVNAGNIGLTFGGGCAYGHGVWISAGSAKFVLTTFEVM